jgi:uncharacterized protein YecT (DUF1311 family)
MRKLPPFLLLSFLLATTPRSFSQHMNLPDSPCANVVSTSDSVERLSKARVSSEAKLDSLYREIQSKLEADEAKSLLATEKLWIQYRDANCEAERNLYGIGTAAGPAYIACLEAMTRERTRELRITYAVRLKKQASGD